MNKSIIIALLIIYNCTVYSQNNKDRIAILDFKIIGREEEIANYKWLELAFAETLSDAFSRIPEFRIIERSQIDRIISEQNLQQQILIDSSSIVAFGKLLGVRAVLIGSCQIYTGHLMVNMRLVDVETGEIQPVSNPVIGPIDDVLNIQKRLCNAILEKYNITASIEIEQDIVAITSESTTNFLAYEYLNRGIEFYNHKQFPEALQMLDLALKHDKRYGKAFYKKGETNIALNNFSEAALNFEKSGRYLKKDSIYILMSEAYKLDGQINKSISLLEKAEAINPNNKSVTAKIYNLKKESLITKKDTNIIETIYEFRNGIAKIKSNNKYGYINLENQIIIQTIYEEIRDFKNGLAPAKLNSKWGFINIEGDFVIPPTYTNVSSFDKYGLSRVELKEKWGIINKTGALVLPIDFVINSYYSAWESTEYIVVTKYKNLLALDLLYGVYDRTGKEILPIVYDNIDTEYFYNRKYNEKLQYNYIHASLNGKWGVVNSQNKIVIPFVYNDSDCIKPFRNGFAAVMINQKWGFVDTLGQYLIAPKYERVEDFLDKYAKVKDKEKWGAVNDIGEEVIPCLYKKLEYIENNYWAAKIDNLWGIINSNNAVICDFEYTKMASEIGNYSYYIDDKFKKNLLKVTVEKDSKTIVINEKCNCIINCK
jgi:TolB-like protein